MRWLTTPNSFEIARMSHLGIGRLERLGGLGQSQRRAGADRSVPVEQGCGAGGHTGGAVVALSRQADEFTVGQSARRDGVVGVDVAQSACAPMGERTGDIADECQTSKRCEGLALHYRAKNPRPE